MESTNYYRLTKKELSFISFIEPPLLHRGERLSRPVVICRLGDRIVYVWTLRLFRSTVKEDLLCKGFVYEIRSMF